MKIRYATLEERDEIVRISKQSKYTKGVTNPMFMNDDTFVRKEVAVAVSSKYGTVGFIVVRHLVRFEWTKLHYVGVDERVRSRGVGEKLVHWMLQKSPHARMQLLCEKDNERAIQFYLSHGFTAIDEGANKAGEPYWIFDATLDEFESGASGFFSYTCRGCGTVFNEHEEPIEGDRETWRCGDCELGQSLRPEPWDEYLETHVVHCKRDEEAMQLYVGRGGAGRAHWGNPFSWKPGRKVVMVKDRAESIERFRTWLEGTTDQEVEPARRKWMLKNIRSLCGKVMGCWCAPMSCHAEVLAEFAYRTDLPDA